MAPVDAKVVGIYPSGDVLPENVLRFYIHFARPMKPHVAFDCIKLLDASGNADEAAFMRFKQELWNEDRTRLAVLVQVALRVRVHVLGHVEGRGAGDEAEDEEEEGGGAVHFEFGDARLCRRCLD